MNAFASYATQANPQAQQRRDAKAEKQPRALDLKLAEKQRLTNSYKAWQREVRTDALTTEPRLRDFLRYLRTVKLDQGDELIDAIATSWLPRSVQTVRIFALRLVNRHADKLARQAGGAPLDDPLPPETSVYFEARALLHKDGRA